MGTGNEASGNSGSQKTSKADLTRQRILDSAAGVFAERGYALTRMSDIAKAANTKAGAMYYHFSSRDDIVEEVLRLSSTRVSEAVEAAVSAMPDSPTWREKMECGIRVHLKQILSRDDYTRAHHRIIDQVPEEVRGRFVHHPRRYARFWDSLIQGARAAGELKKDFDPVILRLFLMGGVTWSLEWYKPGRLTPEKLATEISRIVFDGTAA